MPEYLQKLDLFAAGSVVAGTGAKAAGGANIVTARSGAGVYTLTAGAASFAVATTLVLVTNNNAAGQIVAVITSSTVITVRSFAADGTTATDKDFTYLIYVVEPS